MIHLLQMCVRWLNYYTSEKIDRLTIYIKYIKYRIFHSTENWNQTE